MKYLKYLILLISIFIITSVNAIVTPTNNFYVNDYANVIDSDTENYIMNKAVELYNLTGAQVVVLTVDTLDGMDIETYANTYFNNNGIGSSEKNNGLLIMLAKEERESRIEVGNGLEEYITDGISGRIQDEYMIPDYQNDNFNDGIKKGFDAFISKIASVYDVSISVDTTINQNVYSTESTVSSAIRNVVNLIFVIVYFSVFIIIMVRIIKKGGTSSGRRITFSSSSSSSHHSSSSHSYSGGGGHSSGGGSSRHF